MSDEEEEAFSASEDEWKPSKERGGESSDDDDSDFEEVAATASGAASGASRKRESEPKAGRGGGAAKTKGSAAKKRKPTGQSLRTKLYNKYRPPPKTFLSPTNSGGTAGSNSPSASTSRTASKNAKTPNEGNETRNGGGAGHSSDSECSVDDYLVDPAELDLQSSFFNPSEGGGVAVVGGGDRSRDRSEAPPPPSPPPPVFDCNAGLGNLSDSGSEDNNDSSADERANTKAFDFRNLLEKANSLERAKETIAKRAAEAKTDMKSGTAAAGNADKKAATAATDISSLLALGEQPKNLPVIKKQQQQRQQRQHKRGTKHDKDDDDEEDDDDDDDDDVEAAAAARAAPQRLSKTKSTRVKRHTKVRPVSTVMPAGDSDDSDFEEVADEHSSAAAATSFDSSFTNTTIQQQQELNGSLEIHVELPTRQRTKQSRTQQELELAFKRKLNRDLKERQLLLHKATLLCGLARNYTYNRLLNDTALMQAVLQLLPNQNVYPPASGTSAKYFQSFVKWYGGGGAMRLTRAEMYPPKKGVTKKHVRQELLEQVQRKEAHSQQDYVLLFVALVRAMGLQCRVVVNLQPLPLRPPQSDLVPIKLNAEPPKPTGKVAAVKVAASSSSSPPPPKNPTVTTPPAAAVKTEAPPPPPPKIARKVAPPKAKETSDANSRDQPSTSQSRKVAERKKKSDSEAAMAADTQTTEAKPNLSRLKRESVPDGDVPAKVAKVTKAKIVAVKGQRVKPEVDVGSPKVPTIVVNASSTEVANMRPSRTAAAAKERVQSKQKNPTTATTTTTTTAAAAAPTKARKPPPARQTRGTRSRSRSVSPAVHVSAAFLQTTAYKRKFGVTEAAAGEAKASTRAKSKSPTNTKVQVCPDFLKAAPTAAKRVLRQRQKTNEAANTLSVPQLDGADDGCDAAAAAPKGGRKQRVAPQLRKLRGAKAAVAAAATVDISDEEVAPSSAMSDEDFVPSPPKRPKKAPVLPATGKAKDRRVLSSDDEETLNTSKKSKEHAIDIWAEVYSDVENCWLSVDLFKMKVDAVDAVRRAASSSLAYVFAFQNDLSLKDVTARYCPHWTQVVRKDRVDKAWLDESIGGYLARRTARDRREDVELRRIHEAKPLPTSIADFKNHPLYALERHLLKFQGIYPPDAPPINYIRGEPIYARDCVHLLHSRDIWLKQARTVKLGEKPYKVVKARPKWDRLTQTVIKDQPLEIFGYWQTQQYEPPTAENGIVPRNAYGNVELFKECMLPKKTVHLKLSGLNRICKKLGIDCANAVIGFDFHQGACHPMYDGFVVCEEFGDQVVAAWHQDQEEQERKEIEKRDQRIWGNWKKLIRGLLIRERLKKKYNF